MKSTIFKSTVQWHQVHSHCRTTITTNFSRTFSSSQTETLSPSNTDSFPPPLPWSPPFYFLSL